MRLHWVLAASLGSLAAVSAFFAGPDVEACLAPVHREQRVEAVDRTARQLCWDLASLKVAPYGAADGLPWRKAAAAGLGP